MSQPFRGEIQADGPIARGSWCSRTSGKASRDHQAFAHWLASLRAIAGVVRVRSVWPRSGSRDAAAAAKTVDYLARYANRVAIANSRLLAIAGDGVTAAPSTPR